MINSKNHKQGLSEKSSDRPVEESVNLSNNFSAGIRPNLLSSQVNQPGPAKPASTFENTGVNVESVVQNRKFSSRIIGLLTVAVMLLLAIIFLFLAYNLYRTSYNNIQKSRVATNYDTTSVDLGTGITAGSQGIGILQVNGDANITNNVTANSFSGGGADLTNLNADNITSGTLDDARLSANVALLDANQTFTGSNNFTGNITSSGSNSFTGSNNFTGQVSLPGTLVINSLSYSTPSAQANGVLTNDGSGNLVWQAVGPCATCINNGGDSFGAAISIGTNDNNNLIFKTNNITRLTFNTTGDATFTGAIYGDGTQLTGVAKLALNNQTFTGNNQVFQNTANSTTAFEVKNSGAVSVLTVDTQNGKVIAPTIQSNTITPTSAMTIGSTSQTLTLNGGSSSTWAINGSGFSTTVGFNGVPTSNVMYYFDRTAAAGNYAVCTSAGNCGGGGGITGGGTAGTIAKFTGPSGVGDSLLSESGSQITVNGTFKVLSASPDYMTLNSYGLAVYDDSAGTTTNYLFPAAGNNTYDVCTSSGNCFGSGGVGANTALSNLDSATIAINTSLLPGPIGPINLGSNTKPFGELFIYGTSATPATQNFKLTGSATGARTITFPDYTGTVCTTDGTTAQVCAGYANNTLSNLGTVALNSVLQPATAGALSLGVSTLPFSDLYLSGSSATPATNRFRITGTSSGGLRTITFPDENGTVCTTGSVCSGYAPSTGGSGYVQLQATTPGTQQSGNLNLSGTGIFGSAVSLGTASAANGTIVIKNSTTAFDLTLNAPNTTTSNKTITFPNENGTVCTTGSVCSGYAPSSGSTSYFAQGGNGFGGTAYLGTTDANALVLRTGVGTNAAQTRFTIDAAASNLTGNGATTYSGTGAITLQSSSAASNVNIATNTTSGAITIGGGAQAGGLITIGGVSSLGAGDNATINIGYGNAIQIVTSGIPFAGIYNSSLTIGNSTGGTTVKANSTLTLDGISSSTNINIGDTLTSGNINLGQNITTGSIKIGTSQTSGDITIGGTAGGTTGDIKIGDGGGSGVVSIGNPNTNKTINIGTTAGGAKTITLGGSSANVISIGNSQTAGSIAMGTAMTTGTISIGGSAQTGTINIATGTGNQAVNIGTGALNARTITFGNTLSLTTFAFNSGATTATAMTLNTPLLTNGIGLSITSNSNGMLAGSLLDVSGATAGTNTGYQGNMANFSYAGTNAGGTEMVLAAASSAYNSATYWTAGGTGATFVYSAAACGVANTCVQITAGAGASAYFQTKAAAFTPALVANSLYKVTYTISGYTAGPVTPYFCTSTLITSCGTQGLSRSANGTYTDYLYATSASQLLTFFANPSSVLTISAISIQLVNTPNVMALSSGTLTQGTLLDLNSSNTSYTDSAFKVTTATTATTVDGIVKFDFAGNRTSNTSSGLLIIDRSTTAGGTEVYGGSNKQYLSGSALAVDASTLTSGTSVAITGTDLTSGALLAVRKDGGSSAWSGDLIRVFSNDAATNFTGTYINVVTNENNSATNTGTMVNIQSDGASNLAQMLVVSSGQTTGGTTTLGATTYATSLVNYIFTGARTSGTNYGVAINDAATTATSMGIIANSVTSGAGLYVSTTSLTAQSSNTDTAAGAAIRVDVGGTASRRYAEFTNAGTIQGSITKSGVGTVAYNTTSDARLKENVVDTAYNLDTVLALQIHDFNFIGDPDQRKVTGFIAQELYNLFPDAVTPGNNAVDENGNLANPWAVDYGRLTPLLTKGIQELNTKVDTMQNGLSTSVLQIVADAGAITINGTLTINGITIFNGEVQFNSDTAGTATIPAGQTSISVTFTKPMSKVPRVTATPQAVIDGSVGVTAKSVNGFTIQLQNAQAGDIDIDWQALVSQ